jgi:tetratricopeptide (TPR) repeat protein
MKPGVWGIYVALVCLLGTTLAFGEDLFDTKASDEHFKKGLTYYYQKNFLSAIEEFQEAITIDPDNAKAYYFLGYTHYKTGHFKEALEDFESAYQINTAYTPLPIEPATSTPSPVSE